MKKRVLLCLMLALVMVFATFVVVACDPEEPPVVLPNEGPETGVYYFDAPNDDQYAITLSGGDDFAMNIANDSFTGGYMLEGDKLSLTFNADYTGAPIGLKIIAELKDDVVTLTYDGAEYRLLKKIWYDVDFDVNGGEEMSEVSILNGKTIAQPVAPNREGYGFAGWYQDDDLTTPYDFAAVVTADITLYADWMKVFPGFEEFNVNFALNYEDKMLEPQQTLGGKITNMPLPAREGYQFVGWYFSMFDDGDKLAYQATADADFTKDTTLYAMWNAEGAQAPVARVDDNGVSWDALTGFVNYQLEVKGPAMYDDMLKSINGTTETIDFANAPEGEYYITVTGLGADETGNSATTTLYYNNKALDKITQFSVNDNGILVFNKVDNATNYYITVECGNDLHNHTAFNLGNNTAYNFANCELAEDGITFTVWATGKGYVDSIKTTYTYNRVLDAVEGCDYQEDSQVLYWDAVDNATGYIVKVDGKVIKVDDTHIALGTFDYNAKLLVEVYAVADGYNVAEATYFVCNKATIATPDNFVLDGYDLTWGEVAGATAYQVQIGSAQPVLVNDNYINLAEYAEEDKDCTVKVLAVGANNSLWSQPFVAQAQGTFVQGITYANGAVAWEPMLGVVNYDVRVNGGEAIEVQGDQSGANVTLTQSGYNTIEVRAYDGDILTPWVGVQVYAYEVKFDTLGGLGLEALYLVPGDDVNLPSGTKKGYNFGEWYNSPVGPENNASKYDDEQFAGQGDIVLYAYWAPMPIDVTLDFGGAPEDNYKQKVLYNEDYTLDVPTMDGFTFIGWHNQPGTYEGDELVRYTDEEGNSLCPWESLENMTLYPIWSDSVFVYYELADGTYSVGSGIDINKVKEVTVPATFKGKPVTVVEGNAFVNSINLQIINIPNTVDNIEFTTAFDNCYSLTHINIYEVEGNNKISYASHDGVLYETFVNENGVVESLELIYFPINRGGEYDIPEYANVISIASDAFLNVVNLTKIGIPASVTVIEEGAFEDCINLQDIIFGKGKSTGLVIEEDAFHNCQSLANITLPAAFVDFNRESFDECDNLQNVNVRGDNETYESYEGVLYTKGLSTLVYYPIGRVGEVKSTDIPFKTTTIGTEAFYDCDNITKVTLPMTIQTLEEGAFSNCSDLLEVVFSAGNLPVTIGTDAFRSCIELKIVTFLEGSKVETIGDYAFAMCTDLQLVHIPATVKTIGNGAFEKASGTYSFSYKITELDFEEGSLIETIGDRAFYNALQVQHLVLPEGLLEIGAESFALSSSYNGVRMITIPASLESMGEGAFSQHPLLKTINFPENGALVDIAPNAFKDCIGLTELVVPEYIEFIGNGAFANCSYINSITFAEGSDAELEAGAFDGCIGVSVINIPSTMSTLPMAAFLGCTRLQELNVATNNDYFYTDDNGILYNKAVTELLYYPLGLVLSVYEVPTTVTTIGEGLFRGNLSITNIVIPASVTTIGDRVFEECVNLKNITLVDGEEPLTMGVEVFKYCLSLETIALPNRLVAVSDGLFYGCEYLATVTFGADSTTDTIGKSAFEGTVVTNIQLPDSIKVIDDMAFKGCDLLTAIDLAEVAYIGNEAFSGCGGLESIVIPNTVANLTVDDATLPGIGKEAFADCDKLESVVFEEGGTEPLTFGEDEGTGVSAIGVFDNCDEITTMKLPARLAPIFDGEGEVLVEAVHKCTFSSLTSLEAYTAEEGGEYVIAGADGVLYSADGASIYSYPLAKKGAYVLPVDVLSIAPNAFTGSLVTEVTMPEDAKITVIGNSAFYNANELVAVTISTSVTEIGDDAFDSCDELTTFNIPTTGSKLTTIGDEAFYYCDELTSIYIPASVTLIKEEAFELCKKLDTLVFEMGGTEELSLNDYTGTSAYYGSFRGCVALTEVVLPARTVNLGAGTFGGCTKLKSVTFEDDGPNLTKLSSDFLYGCTSLESFDIPDTVTEIGEGAFEDCAKLASITLHDGITTLGANAFDDCVKLANVTFPTSLKTIGNYAFRDCDAFTEITLANSINSVGIDVFEDCSNLQTIKLSEAMTAIADSLFEDCGDLASIVIPANVVSIGDNAFEDCFKLVDVTFAEGSGLTTIDKWAFKNCKVLTEINLPNTIKTMSTAYNYTVFDGCAKLADVNIAEGGATYTSIDGMVVKVDDMLLAFYTPGQLVGGAMTIPEGVETIDKTAFYDDSLLKSIALPASLKTIAKDAFKYCDKLTTVTFAANSELEYIGEYAFYDSVIKSIDIPAGVTEIAARAFYLCEAMETVNFAKGSELTNLGIYAFYKTGITEITIPSGVTAISDYAFKDCSKLAKVNLPEGLETIGKESFRSNGSLFNSKTDFTWDDEEMSAVEGIRIPSTVTSIGEDGFRNCNGLFYIDLPEGLTEIADRAFRWCNNLLEITIPDGVTTIGVEAFSVCSSLTTVTLGAGVEVVDSSAFASCGMLVNINLNDSLKSIEDNVFAYCSSLTNITFPDGLEYIGSYAFMDCTSLEGLTLPAGVEMGANIVSGCPKITRDKLILPAGGDVYYADDDVSIVDKAGNLYIVASSAPSTYTIPDGVKYIKAAAMMGCKNITSIVIPDATILEIGRYAFSDCTNLEEVIISDDVTELGADVFDGCENIKHISLGEGISEIDDELFEDLYTLETVKLGNDIAELDSYMFEDMINLHTINIPDSVTSLPSNLFKNCTSLDNIELPAELKSIEYGVFENTAITSVHIGEYVTDIGSYAFRFCDKLESVTFEPGQLPLKLASSLFAECTSLKEIVIPNRIYTTVYSSSYYGSTTYSSVPDYAFDGCTGLELVEFEEGGSDEGINIGKYAFRDCSSLRYVKLPLRLASKDDSDYPAYYAVEDYAFQGCIALETIELEEGRSTNPFTLGSDVFSGCINLVNVNFPSTMKTFASSMFKGCTKLESITIPEGLTTIPMSAFEGCTALTSIVIPENVVKIMSNAFAGCTALEEVEIQGELTDIFYEAFEDCTALDTINIPDTIVDIGEYAFKNCTSLTTFDLPASLGARISDTSYLWKIGKAIFDGCTALTSVTIEEGSEYVIVDDVVYTADMTALAMVLPYATLTDYVVPNTVNYIAERAFQNSTVQTVALPASLVRICDNAFDGCADMTAVTIPTDSKLEWIGIEAFYNCESLESIYMPTNVLKIMSRAFMGCTDLATVTFADDCELANDQLFTQAFENCASLQAIKLPAGINDIAVGTFRGCTSLAKVELPSGVTIIDKEAFKGCANLTAFTLPADLATIGIGAFGGANIDAFAIEADNDNFAIDANGSITSKDGDKLIYASLSIPAEITLSPDIALEKGAYAGNATITKLIIPNTVDLIPENAFAYCVNLAEIVFEEGGDRLLIDNNAFEYCTSLKTLVFPERLYNSSYSAPAVDNYAFRGCTALTSVAVVDGHEGNLEYGDYAFAGCTSLETVEFAGATRIIREYVFLDCTALTSVTYPDTMYYMEEAAFKNCTSLNLVFEAENISYVNAELFSGWTAEQTITIIGISEIPAEWDPSTYSYKDWNVGCNATFKFAYYVTYMDGDDELAETWSIVGETLEGAPVPTKDGFTFAGWYTDAGLTTAWDMDTDVLAEEMTLYASWTPVAPVV